MNPGDRNFWAFFLRKVRPRCGIVDLKVMAPSQFEKKPRARAQPSVPCTIPQLLPATLVDDVFRIGGVETSEVTIVGIIRHTEKTPTNTVYKVDDMTAAPGGCSPVGGHR